MKVIADPKELEPRKRRICVAIGFFDGVHLGHQQIVRKAVADAQQHEGEALIVSFDQHPNSVVAPARNPPLIYSLAKKIEVLGSLGPPYLWLIHFDRAFSQQSGEEFIRKLARDFEGLRSICVGENFVFGHKRNGNVELLRRLGAELRFAVHGLAAVALDGQAVSSTRIRQRILAGDLDAAGQMLGREYSLSGTVVAGDRVGQQLGFPTANLDVSGLALPPSGVYAAQARAGADWHRAVVNIGRRPTLGQTNPPLRVEAHLLDFKGDLYGRELELVFVEKLREEMKFGGLEELREQIGRDISQARQKF